MGQLSSRHRLIIAPFPASVWMVETSEFLKNSEVWLGKSGNFPKTLDKLENVFYVYISHGRG
jgi:hypothetical protein